jgi:RecA-family ATPase
VLHRERDLTISKVPKIFLIGELLGCKEISCWYGQPASGKSTCIIDAACHVAAGCDYYGHKLTQGAVLYMAAERGQNVMRRIIAWRQKHKIQGFPIAVIDDTCNLRSNDFDAKRIIAAASELAKIEAVPVVWIIFDTLSRVLAAGDENSSRDMGQLAANVELVHRATGAHCSLVHHVPYGAERMRGWGGMNGVMDTTVGITKDKAGSGAVGAIARGRPWKSN